jgi:hypothetical protein
VFLSHLKLPFRFCPQFSRGSLLQSKTSTLASDTDWLMLLMGPTQIREAAVDAVSQIGAISDASCSI